MLKNKKYLVQIEKGEIATRGVLEEKKKFKGKMEHALGRKGLPRLAQRVFEE